MIPQLIYIAMIFLGLGLLPKKKGQYRTHNIFIDIVTLILMNGLFYWGGFWDNQSWPQVIMSLLMLVTLSFSAYNSGKTDIHKGLTYSAGVGTLLQTTILYFGGFFDPMIGFFK